MTRREKENAARLAYALERHADPQTLAVLARLLHYDPAQLAADIKAAVQAADAIR